MRRVVGLLFVVFAAACGGTEVEPPECTAVASADFDADSGWGGSYCPAPTTLGCYPWHESAADTCGAFISMRTSATSATSVDACRTLLSSINCNEYASADGSTRLGFYVEDADRFTARAFGTYRGTDVDTTFYFNPCQGDCLAAVTLVTLDPEQQKICDIPSLGKPVCMFPESAHSVTFVRADGGSIVMRTAGKETAMERVSDAE